MPSVAQVTAHGEFAVRGSLLDVFPMGSRDAAAHRSVRRRDRDDPRLRPGDQRSLDNAASSCGCCRRASSRSIAEACRRSAAAIARASRAIRRASADLPRGQRGTGARRHRVLPAAVLRATETLFDYLPRDARARRHGRSAASAPAWCWHDIVAALRTARHDIERPVLAPDGAVPAARRSCCAAGTARRVAVSSLASSSLEAGAETAQNFATARCRRDAAHGPARRAPARRCWPIPRRLPGRVLLAADPPAAARCCSSCCATQVMQSALSRTGMRSSTARRALAPHGRRGFSRPARSGRRPRRCSPKSSSSARAPARNGGGGAPNATRRPSSATSRI